MWDQKEQGAPRSPHGKMSSDSPRLPCCGSETDAAAAAIAADRGLALCPARGAGGRGAGASHASTSRPQPGLSAVSHTPGAAAWHGGALRSGDMRPSSPQGASGTDPQDLLPDKNVSKRPWGRSAQPGASALPSPWGPCPFPYLAPTAALGELRVTPRRISVPRAGVTPAPEAPTGTHNCPRARRLTTKLPG